MTPRATAIDKSGIQSSPLLSGPYTLFNGDFTISFLQPPVSLNATVLMRCTYLQRAGAQGRKHPQSPPLHLHFDQVESFYVESGRLGVVKGWDLENKEGGWGREHGVGSVEVGVPHTFYPHPDAECDTTFHVWAHPDGVPEPMDRLFFEGLLRYVSDGVEGKRGLSVVQVLVTQHASATAMVMFPTAWWLGPLRWYVPWRFQGAVAWVGRCCGYRPLMREYMSEEEWKAYIREKKL